MVAYYTTASNAHMPCATNALLFQWSLWSESKKKMSTLSAQGAMKPRDNIKRVMQ